MPAEGMLGPTHPREILKSEDVDVCFVCILCICARARTFTCYSTTSIVLLVATFKMGDGMIDWSMMMIV